MTHADGTDRQQIRQQSGREATEPAAPRCDSRTDDRAPRPRANSAPQRALRGPARLAAPRCDGEGEGTRTLDFQRDRLEGGDASGAQSETSEAGPDDASRNTSSPQVARPPDAELEVVVAAWSDLPAAIRAGIVAMIRATGRASDLS